MDEQKDSPKVFANSLIRQLVDHSLGGEVVLTYKDYQVIRTAFRSLDGSWEQLGLGDYKQLNKLKEVITAWSNGAQQKHIKVFV